MASHGLGGGGPLLRLADMLQDLAEEDWTSEPIAPEASSITASPSSSSHKPESEKKNLPAAFEKTYSELKVALTQSGHTWTELTQELCATLRTADKLVATSQLNLGQLRQEVAKLEKIVERGHAAVTKLQIAVGQVDDKVLVSL